MENDKIISNPNNIIKFGFSVLFIVFGLFFGWMAFAPLAISIVSVGEVSVDTNKKTVQHYEGGIIKKILVKDGDFVEKGDSLIVLDSTQIESNLKTNQNQYYGVIAAAARLKAQKNKSLTIHFPKELLDKKNEASIKTIIESQTNILRSKLRSVEEEELISKQKIIQSKNQIAGLNSIIKSNEDRLKSILTDIAGQEELFAQRLVDIQKLQELRREEMKIRGDIQNSLSDKKRLYAQIEEVKGQQELKNKEFQNEVLNSIVEYGLKKVDLQSKITISKDQLKRVNIVAPVSGYIIGLSAHTIGGVIDSSKPILSIVPKDSDLFILTKAQTQDIDKLKVGLLADTRFSAFNTQQTYTVESKVINISADTFVDENNGTSYYEVKLILTEDGKKQLKDNGFYLLPGMPVEAMIKTGNRTTLSYLIKPFVDMISRAFNEE